MTSAPDQSDAATPRGAQVRIHESESGCSDPVSLSSAYDRQSTTWGVSCAALLAFLGAMLSWATWRSIPRIGPGGPMPPTVTYVDPNVAPWWELTVLPRIGENLARTIVLHRESAVLSANQGGQRSTAFIHTSDLEAVRGIGPKTVQRIAPHVRITDCESRVTNPLPGS